MRSNATLHRTTAAAFVALTFSAMSCREAPSEVSHESMHDAAQAAMAKSSGNGSETSALLKRVHAATARYHSTVQATKAGYAVVSPCVSRLVLGGMGFHWVKGSIVDPVFNPMEPEGLLYAPDKHGKLKLVAVEYIVLDVGQARPYFGDHLMDIRGTPRPGPHWSLHVWLYEENPNGVFTPYNPSVVCP